MMLRCCPPTSSHSTRARLACDSMKCNNDSHVLTQSKTAGTKTFVAGIFGIANGEEPIRDIICESIKVTLKGTLASIQPDPA